jgi:hypothetical protein
MSESESATPDLVAELDAADARVQDAESRVEQFGQEKLRDLADAYYEFTELLDRYEDQVVGDAGDYETNIEFQSQIAEFLSGISEEILLYETFEECDEHLQQRWFKESHFEHVRDQLEPVADMVARLEEYDDAVETYRETRREIDYRIRELDQEISELERLQRLGGADLDAPTERLREPIEAYNEAVTEAFDKFRREASAREIIKFLDEMAAYPLVEFTPPQEELREFIREQPPGTESISTLVDYAGYSRSKLDHYVDDPDRLKHVISGQQTYLEGLDAEPLRIEWPPPQASELTYRCEELTSAVNRFAPDVVAELRTVAALPREVDYQRLRESVLAREELTDAERDRIESGDLEGELEQARQEREQLEAALEEYPDR